LQFEEFAPLIAWWHERKESAQAWKLPAADILANGCNLDRKNPTLKQDIPTCRPNSSWQASSPKSGRLSKSWNRCRRF
jgi:type I restriction enzyme M protein